MFNNKASLGVSGWSAVTRLAATYTLISLIVGTGCIQQVFAHHIGPRLDHHEVTTSTVVKRKRISGVKSTEARIYSAAVPPALKLHGYTFDEVDKQVTLNTTQSRLGALFRSRSTTLPADVRPFKESYYVINAAPEQRQAVQTALDQVGGKLVEAVPNLLVVSLKGKQAEQLSEMNADQDGIWMSRYLPKYKKTDSLQKHITAISRKPSTVDSPPQKPLPPEYTTPTETDAGDDGEVIDLPLPPEFAESEQEQWVKVNIFLFPEESADEVSTALQNLNAREVSRGKNADTLVIKATIPVVGIEELTLLEPVQFIEPAVEPSFRNDVALLIIDRDAMSNPSPYQGAEQIIGHADSGLDRGRNDESLHQAFQGRLRKTSAWGRKSAGDWSDWNGHGTHTAGSIVGATPPFKGIAPQAQLVHQSLGDENGGLGGIPTAYGDLFDEAYDEGARIHSDSWGISTKRYPYLGGKYLNGRQVDQWTWNNGVVKDMLIVIANGNDGSFGVGSPATAKNALSVGAIENRRPELGYFNADNPAEPAGFSSVGPTEDGRVKPDIVAPGTWVASAKTQGERIVWQTDLEDASVWQRIDGFQWNDVQSLSGTQSLHNQRSAGEVFQDIVESEAFSTPAIAPLTVNFAVFGNVGAGNHFCLYLRAPAEALTPLDCVGPVQHTQWTHYAYSVPESFLDKSGVSLMIASFNNDPATAAVDIFIDDIEITTFSSWGRIAMNGLGNHDGPEDRLYTLSGGTSMATPIAAGAAAVIRQALQDGGEAEPSAELLKAIMINTADPIGRPRPNMATGWGRLDLDAALNDPLIYDYLTELNDGENISYSFTITDPTVPVRATLVWADPPGESLINNLDMKLVSPGNLEHFPLGATASAPDLVNNVEHADIVQPDIGTWQLQVTANGVDQSTQPFAVVISGGLQ